jgi:hypothetical protein
MRRSIPHDCVARRLHGLLFALLAPCHAGASTPENVTLFLGEPYASQLQATFARFQIPKASK